LPISGKVSEIATIKVETKKPEVDVKTSGFSLFDCVSGLSMKQSLSRYNNTGKQCPAVHTGCFCLLVGIPQSPRQRAGAPCRTLLAERLRKNG
jgi:hypothetical protein